MVLKQVKKLAITLPLDRGGNHLALFFSHGRGKLEACSQKAGFLFASGKANGNASAAPSDQYA